MPKPRPTHRGYAQYTERGQPPEWYPTGYAWLTKDANGKTVIRTEERASTRTHSGTNWYYEIGETPPPPKQVDEDTGEDDEEQ
jgi:hypothetical protein